MPATGAPEAGSGMYRIYQSLGFKLVIAAMLLALVTIGLGGA